MPDVRFTLTLFLLLICYPGCDDEEKQLRDWQRQQVDQLQRQSQENSTAARALVEADAESRRQFVDLQQSVQAERQELAGQYTALEADRKDVAAARERVPLLATALQGLAAMTLGVASLWICARLLGRMSDDTGSAELEETLILSLAGETDLLAERPALLKPLPEVPTLPSESTDADPPALVHE